MRNRIAKSLLNNSKTILIMQKTKPVAIANNLLFKMLPNSILLIIT